MFKQVIKKIILYSSTAISLFCVGLYMMEKLIDSRIIKFTYYGIFAFKLKGYLFLLDVFYCAIGIILFIIMLIKKEIKISKYYLLLIPSIIISIYLVNSMVNTIRYGHQLMGDGIPILFFAIGSPLFLLYNINQNINQKYKLIFNILLCLFFPVNTFLSLFEVLGWMGI